MPSTRSEARLAGVTRYFNGKPCPYGHVAERLAVNFACSKCHNERAKKWNKKNPEKLSKQRAALWEKNKEKHSAKRRASTAANKKEVLLNLARQRARKKGVEFSLTVDGLKCQSVCPVFGIEINYAVAGKWAANSPTIDRINPNVGYTQENCRVISFRANALKSNGSAAEHKLIAQYMEKNLARECGI